MQNSPLDAATTAADGVYMVQNRRFIIQYFNSLSPSSTPLRVAKVTEASMGVSNAQTKMHVVQSVGFKSSTMVEKKEIKRYEVTAAPM